MNTIYNILYIITFCLCLLSCTKYEHEDIITDDNLYFENITYAEGDARNSIIKKTSFDENDSILFNSYGSHPNNGILIYNEKEWSCRNKLKWNENSFDSIHYTAFFPASHNGKYSEKELYKNGMLDDILFCISKKKYKEKISLKFKHIFSILNLDLSNFSDVQDIQSIEVSIPAIIDSIEINNGKIHVNRNKTAHFTLLTDTKTCCEFIVPSIKDLTISLRINTEGKSIEKEITNTNYEEGNIYTCNIIRQDKSKGIKTAEDFVAFSYLINNIEYKDRTLDEFYYTEKEKKIFSLLNNITFTEEQCQQLKMIGSEKNMFNDIFDGKQHTIRNLIISNESGRKSLFGDIGKNGNVMNIIIEKSIVYARKSSDIAMIACKNYGTIDNCMIGSCELQSKAACNGCFISYYNYGAIINSKVCSSELKCEKGTCNSIIANIQRGIIINCYSSNNMFYCASSSLASAFVFNPSDGSEIKNCYVRCNQKKENNIFSYSYFCDENYIIENCFMYGNFSANKDNKNKESFNIFDNQFFDIKTNIRVSQLLNEWIDNNQHLYPQYKFKKWKINTTFIPGIHIE